MSVSAVFDGGPFKISAKHGGCQGNVSIDHTAGEDCWKPDYQKMRSFMKRKNQNPRVVLYLGAGASQFAGFYTFVDFPQLLFNTDLRAKEGMPCLSDNSERILKAIKGSLERNNKATTHDNFLWRLDAYTQLLRLNLTDDVLQDFLRENTKLHDLHVCTVQAISQISATTVRHYSTNRVEQAKHSDATLYQRMERVFCIYAQLALLNGQPPCLPLFTTNYDLFIEDLTAEFGDASEPVVTLTNGIPGLTQEESRWDESQYTKHELYGCSIELYRLHGCVCWFNLKARGDGVVCFHRRDAAQQEIGKLCAMYPGIETERGAAPHGCGFRILYSVLQTCDLVVFIGFSFRDDDVMHVLLKAFDERRGRLRALIIDPLYTRTDVQRKLEDAARRSILPYRIPRDHDLVSLNMRFGEEESLDNKILETCKNMLE